MDETLRALHRRALAGDAEAALQFAREFARISSFSETENEKQLAQLRKSCQEFIGDVYHALDTGLVLGTVLAADHRRHEFEWQILRPFMKQTRRYLAQGWPPGRRCHHIHNAHGIARCCEEALPNQRYCYDHVHHRDNYPHPIVSQEEVDRITAQEITNMQGQTYARDS